MKLISIYSLVILCTTNLFAHTNESPINICKELPGDESLHLCVSEKTKNEIINDSLVWRGLKWAGQLGNGAEAVIRIVKTSQKAMSLMTYCIDIDTNWLKETLLYNGIEVCDHAAEAFDLPIRQFIRDEIAIVSSYFAEVFYHGTNILRFAYLAYAWRTDVMEVKHEAGQSTKQTAMNTFALLVTTYNILSLLSQTVSNEEVTNSIDTNPEL